jgi:hypothetical protein
VSSPTQRTLAELKKRGYLAAVVEKWNPHARIRQDLFGCIDILALKDGATLAVQATSGSNVASRVKKIAENEALPEMRAAGWSIAVWGWRKASNGRWQLREVDVS